MSLSGCFLDVIPILIMKILNLGLNSLALNAFVKLFVVEGRFLDSDDLDIWLTSYFPFGSCAGRRGELH